MGGQNDGRAEPARLSPTVADLVGPYLVEPSLLPPPRDYFRSAPLSPVRGRDLRDFYCPGHHLVGQSSKVRHATTTVPSRARRATSSSATPSSRSTSAVSAPSTGAAAP